MPPASAASASPSDVPWPTPAAAAFDPAAFGWRGVGQILDLNSTVIGYQLAVGYLDGTEPRWTIDMTVAPWQFTIFATQHAVTAGPASGWVVYVNDDGAQSEVRAVRVDGTAEHSVITLSSVVFDAVLAPDGSAAYLDLLNRASGREEGVVSVALGGSGSSQPVMAPAPVDLAIGGPGQVRLVAVSRFVRDLAISPSGTMLARFACGEPFGQCLLEVVDLDTNAQLTLEDPIIWEFFGVSDTEVVGRFTCGDDSCIVGVTTDDGSRRTLELAGGALYPGRPAVGGTGGLVFLGTVGGTYYHPPGAELWGYDLDSSVSVRLLAMDGGFGIGLEDTSVDQFAELPWGWALVLVCPVESSCQTVALNLSDLSQIPISIGGAGYGGGHD